VSDFLASPVWGAVIALLGSLLTAIFALVWRVSSKVSSLTDDIGDLKADMKELKDDPNVIRWSDMGWNIIRRRRRGF
jgi:hypothetical protein